MRTFIRAYLDDLKTDLRKPTSVLDATNMALRRLNLLLVKHIHENGDVSWSLNRFQRWIEKK